MDFVVFIAVVCILYGMLMFFDYFFKSCMMLPYLDFLQASGISVRFFRLQFHTTKINRTIIKWSTKMPGIYRQSFRIGTYVTIVLFPIALGMIIATLLPASKNTSSAIDNVPSQTKGEDIARLEILLPGVNLPINEIGYYIIALLICSVVHEAGHGIAAVLEEVPVIGFGLQLFFVIPVAYTEIDMDQLQSAKLMKKLKIYSAGIWNNILLAGTTYTLLLLLPLLLTPLYETNQAIFITRIKQKAPIRGENGLYIGDRVFKVNGCVVTSQESWVKCLSESIAQHPAYCVSEEFVHDNEESIHEIEHQKDGTVGCCPKNAALNCFENFDEQRLPQYICLNIRNTVEHSQDYCHKTPCSHHTSCIKPSLSNSSTIIHLKRRNRVKDMVYFGHPYDILRNVEISEFIPKTNVFEPWFAEAFALILKYLTVFSSGLAIVNVLPGYGLDGQFLITALVANLSSTHFTKSKKELIANSINLIGSATLFLAIFKIIYTTFV